MLLLGDMSLLASRRAVRSLTVCLVVSVPLVLASCRRKGTEEASGWKPLQPASRAEGPAPTAPPGPVTEAAVQWQPVEEGDTLGDRKKADDLVLKAAELARVGRRAEAIARLVEAGNLSPKDAGIRGALARLLLEDGQKLRALDEFRRAVTLDPGNADNTFGLAATLIDLGKAAEARPLLEDLANKRPDDPRVQSLLAAARGGTGDADAALNALKAAARAEPANAARQAEYGTALAREGKYGEAVDALTKAAEANPKDAAAQLQLGTALAQAGKHEAAETALVTAAKLDPKERGAWFNLGVLREERGDLAGAAEAYESLLKNVNNGDPEGKLKERVAILRQSAQSKASAPQSGIGNGQTGSHQP